MNRWSFSCPLHLTQKEVGNHFNGGLSASLVRSRSRLAIVSKIGNPLAVTGRCWTKVQKFLNVLQIESLGHWGSSHIQRRTPTFPNAAGFHKGENSQGSSYHLVQQDGDRGTVNNPAKIWAGSEMGCTDLVGCLAGGYFRERIFMTLRGKNFLPLNFSWKEIHLLIDTGYTRSPLFSVS